jgi:hypothetical protein
MHTAINVELTSTNSDSILNGTFVLTEIVQRDPCRPDVYFGSFAGAIASSSCTKYLGYARPISDQERVYIAIAPHITSAGMFTLAAVIKGTHRPFEDCCYNSGANSDNCTDYLSLPSGSLYCGSNLSVFDTQGPIQANWYRTPFDRTQTFQACPGSQVTLGENLVYDCTVRVWA